jgi:diguanylate cyclase (GGDEF)-like protein
MSDAHRLTSFSRDLLQALEIDPSTGREGWLAAILRAAQEATGSCVTMLGETNESECSQYGWIGSALVRRREPPASDLSRELLEAGGWILESRLRRQSPFHRLLEGWPGVSPIGAAAASLPLRSPSRAWIAFLRSREDPPFKPETLEMVKLAAEAAVTGLYSEARFKKLEQLAMTDELTDIPNYRHLRRTIDSQIAVALARDEYFSVVMVDVDNLKRYNAAHGHLAGSEALRRLARLLQQNVRAADVAAKYGGDEFVLVLPRTRPSGGMTLSERIRRKIEENLRGRGGEILSASFGVAGFPEDGCDFESLVRAADQALYRAKTEGRNSVVCLAAQGGGIVRADRVARLEEPEAAEGAAAELVTVPEESEREAA